MTKRLHLTALATSLFLPLAAMADGGVAVTLPLLPSADEALFRDMLTDLVRANVISSNCPGYAITDGEWGLITGTADMIAAELGLDDATYDDEFYGPAFDLLDKPGNCDVWGPKVSTTIELLRDMGGLPYAAG